MSRPSPPKPAKLVIGLFTNQIQLMHALIKELNDMFGPIELVSTRFEFKWTDYYEPEMGGNLFRRMTAFGPLINQDALADIKLQTNRLEARYADGGKRRINIDPGYLLAERFVLATGKNYTHRIYIGHNIYADLTLIYQNGKFQPLPWTYPDYAADDMHVFLTRVRNKYLNDLKTSRRQ